MAIHLVLPRASSLFLYEQLHGVDALPRVVEHDECLDGKPKGNKSRGENRLR